jgi:hypothetical protein
MLAEVVNQIDDADLATVERALRIMTDAVTRLAQRQTETVNA